MKKILILLMLFFTTSSYAQLYHYTAVGASIGVHVDQESYNWSDWVETSIPVTINVALSKIKIDTQEPQIYSSRVDFNLPIFSTHMQVYSCLDIDGKVVNVALYIDSEGMKNICIHYNDIGFTYCLVPNLEF